MVAINTKKNGNEKHPIFTADFPSMIRIIFWNSTGFYFFNFIIPFVSVQMMNASGVQLGLVFSSQTIGALLAIPIVGYFTDRSSKKRLVLIGSFGRGGAYLVLYLAIYLNSLLLFSIGTFTLGVGVGIFWTPLDALVAMKSSKIHRSKAYGLRNGQQGWGMLGGSLVSMGIFMLATKFAPGQYLLIYSPLLLFAFCNFYGGFLFDRSVNESITYVDDSVENSIHSTPLKSEEKSKNHNNRILGYSLLLGAMFFSSVNIGLGEPFLQAYFIENVNADPIIVMLIYFPSLVLSELFAPYLGYLTDRIKPVHVITFTCIIGATFTWFLVHVENAVLFGVILFVDQGVALMYQLNLRNYISRVSKLHRGVTFGTTNWTRRLGAIFGPLVGGLLWDTGAHRFPFITSIFVEISLIPLYLYAIRYLDPYLDEKLDQ